jgi:hypothetical protein
MTGLMNIETWCALTYILCDPPRSKGALMEPRLNDYYAPIGKLTIAAATLESVALRWAALLSEDDVEDTRFKYLTRSLEAHLNLLADRVKERISSANQQSVFDLIERGRKLKDQRNENVHAVWAEMVHADTGEFTQFTRSRYDKDKATHTTKWDVGVPPSIEELEKLADDLRTLAHELNNHLANLWATDGDVYHWRDQHRF